MDFFNADLLNHLPATVVSCIMPVSIHHTFDTFSEDVVIRNRASRQLDQCRAMLYTLAERQFAPSWALQIIEFILSRARRRGRSVQDRSSKGSGPLNADDASTMTATNRVEPVSYQNGTAATNMAAMDPGQSTATILQQPLSNESGNNNSTAAEQPAARGENTVFWRTSKAHKHKSRSQHRDNDPDL